ncbi:lysozyme inhibitor LprI family protein [Methylocystis sp. SC2]|uniref:lysozyme inhibitor LprI family protein n=1 Tax=Methylocystis sp. (strain SC2) TaxID=187303 RepID=UPI001FCA4C6C|nr:lysozyme inhibitor LprI family protein [Methylocystis sp. SC2]
MRAQAAADLVAAHAGAALCSEDRSSLARRHAFQKENILDRNKRIYLSAGIGACISAISLFCSAAPARAIDCALAQTRADKAICADAEARAADDLLGLAYNRLREEFTAKERSALKESQTEWIQWRNNSCEDQRETAPFIKCLIEATRQRETYLAGRATSGSGGHLVVGRPFFMRVPAAKGQARLTITAFHFRPGAAWMADANRFIDEHIQSAIDDSKLENNKASTLEGHEFFVDLSVQLNYLSANIASIGVVYENVVGQAHPFRYSVNKAFDVNSGRVLNFDDLFDEAGAKQILQLCAPQVKEQKDERDSMGEKLLLKKNLSDDERGEVSNRTRELANWSFTISSAMVDYGDYAFGGFGQCMCQCELPYSILNRIIKKEYILQ